MPDLEENISRLRQEVTRLRTQVRTLEENRAQGRATLALLLQTARSYRDAHATMQQDVRRDLPGNPLADFGRDEAGAKERAQALCSAQTMLFAAMDVVEEKDVVEEEAEQTLEAGDTPPK